MISEDEGAQQNKQKNQFILDNIRGTQMRLNDLAEISDHSDGGNIQNYIARKQPIQTVANVPPSDSEVYHSVADQPMVGAIDRDSARMRQSIEDQDKLSMDKSSINDGAAIIAAAAAANPFTHKKYNANTSINQFYMSSDNDMSVAASVQAFRKVR